MQGALDVFFDYTIQSDQSRFSIHPRFDRFGLRVLTILQFLAPDGSIRAFEYEGGDRGSDSTGSRMAADGGHVRDDGIPLSARRHRFTCCSCSASSCRSGSFASSSRSSARLPRRTPITFIASAFGMAPGVSWFPPLVITLVAISILYVAVDNVIGLGEPGRGPAHLRLHRRWMTAFAFGLVHGFAFSICTRPDAAVRRLTRGDRRSLVQRGHRARHNCSSSCW